MHFLSRRDFLRDSAALAALAAAGSSLQAEESAKKVKDKNDEIHVACIGVRGQGRSHVGGYAGKHGCVVTTICDADEAVVPGAIDIAKKGQGKAPKYVQDIRKVVEDPSIDVISIATPNHWHALAAIWGLMNGKHVYVEKPVSHNVSEGRRIVQAARYYKKVCQTGTQIRSTGGTQDAIKYLHEGNLGKIKVARGLCYKNRPSIGKVDGPQEPPATLDYNLWCGPASDKKPHRKSKNGTVHYDWHWIWEYGNGDLGNQGIHQMDVARWGLGKKELAANAFSIGGRFGYTDDGETPNTQICVFDYGDAELIFEVRGLPSPSYRGAGVGNVFHCADGYLVCTGYNTAIAYSNKGEKIKEFKGGGDHFGNFIKAVRANDAKLLNADIEEGHLSSALCHLANISYRLGQEQTLDATRGALGDDKDAVESLARTQEHLKDKGVMLDGLKYRVGRKLKLEPGKEEFVGDKEANALLTREYRKGFEVPAKIG